jgi:ubiquinone/menaquinone biosynthesis C-methylase UbiE
MSSSASALRLLNLIQSHRVTAVIYVAVRLGIAELLRHGPKTLDELANATGADRNALRRLLAALSTVGICARNADGYELTELGAGLDSSAGHSLKAWAILESEVLCKSWAGMLDSVMTGETAAQLQGFGNSFDLMSRTPENVRIFNAAMTDLTRLVMPEILSVYDFAGISHLMDVGGGSGELMSAIATKHQHLRGTIFDLPRCADVANDHLQQSGVADRVRFVAGDFFETVPRIADAIILKSVIHDWDDTRSDTILQNCRRALPDGGILLLVERILSPSPTVTDQDRSHAMSDLNMLRGPGGHERTEAEYRHLLNHSGFRLEMIYPAGYFSVLAARIAAQPPS